MDTTDAVNAVRFGCYTDDEAIRLSLVKITNPKSVDEWGKPVPNGLHDPAMGPLDDSTRCASCGERSYQCHGHCGHIELNSIAYNPLMFNTLSTILHKTCLYCSQFQSTKKEVERCVCQLELIKVGDLAGAKNLASRSISKGILKRILKGKKYMDDEQSCWSSAQLSEAMSVMSEFFKREAKECMHCKRNSKITTPTFGCFQVEVANAGDHSRNDDSKTAESNSVKRPLLQSEVRDILRRLWENEARFCSYISDIQQHNCEPSRNKTGYSMFFLETILVPANKFRLPSQDNKEHMENILLGKVMQSNIALGDADINSAEGSKLLMKLQQSINAYFGIQSAYSVAQKGAGICQRLDGKNGIFRRKIMGKRVNFACRSVICPDPYLSVNEIGIPSCFALELTYPERVTPWNAVKLRGAVVNGPDIHPGAKAYTDSTKIVDFRRVKKFRVAISRKLPSSRGEYDFEEKVVHRHLQDGDIVLVNRQPTLHKSSIMAHVVRVLHGEKIFRMHYANCSSYNADFDGDEMNVHFPQDEISRAEAYSIVNANEQYIVPTGGGVVRGLIQDHIVGAVLLTMKNTFLTRSEFSQLLYGSGVYASGPGSLPQNHSRKVILVDSEGLVESVLPTVWKPEPLWTGKQVITALLNHITRGCAPFTVENEWKIPKNYFFGNTCTKGEEDEDQNAEHNLLVWKNELVRGVIDQAQFRKYGLLHTVQELYGSDTAGIFLSALSRVFTIILQIHGFTCGLDDLIILPNHDDRRKAELEQEDVGEEVHREFVKCKRGLIGAEELQLEIEKVIYSDRESSTASLDMKMKKKLTDKLTGEGSQIKHLLTAGLLKPFPKNCFSLMTTTGAKGSTASYNIIIVH